jgi:hypothetical protein
MTTPTQTPDFYWKQYDTAPTIQVQLTDSTGAPIDVTGSTVFFVMKAPGAGTTKIKSAGVLVTPASGVVSYSPTGTDLDTAGSYQAEWQLVYPSGKRQTFPDPGYLLVMVTH